MGCNMKIKGNSYQKPGNILTRGSICQLGDCSVASRRLGNVARSSLTAACDEWLTPRATNPGCLVLCLAPAEGLLFSDFLPDHSSSLRRVFPLWSITTLNGLCNWMSIAHWRLLMGWAHQDLKRAAWGTVGGGRTGSQMTAKGHVCFCALLLQTFAEANKKWWVYSVYYGMNYKQKLVSLVPMMNENRKKFLVGKISLLCKLFMEVNCPRISGSFLWPVTTPWSGWNEWTGFLLG